MNLTEKNTQIQHYVFTKIVDVRNYWNDEQQTPTLTIIVSKRKAINFFRDLQKVEKSNISAALLEFTENSKKEENEKRIFPSVIEYIKRKSGPEIGDGVMFSVLSVNWGINQVNPHEIQITAICNGRDRFNKEMANMILRGRYDKIINYINVYPEGNNKFAKKMAKIYPHNPTIFWKSREGIIMKMAILGEIFPWFHFGPKMMEEKVNDESNGKQ